MYITDYWITKHTNWSL